MPDYKYVDKTVITDIDDIEELNLGPNMVLVKPVVDNSKLANGLYMDTSWRELDCANRIVEIIQVPSKLAIKGLDGFSDLDYRALDWSTIMELKVGDIAWVDPLHVVLNNDTSESKVYKCNDELYYLIKYDKFIVAKRDGKIICLNGNILIEEKKKEIKIGAYKKTILEKEGVVAYAGRANDYYYNRPYSDNIKTNPGDVVYCPKYRIYLEDEQFACFDEKKIFLYTQRKNIIYSYKSDEMSLENRNILPGKLWVKKDEVVKETKTGLIIPSEAVKAKNTGVVALIGPERDGFALPKLKVGCRISFLKGGREVVCEGETYASIDILEIEYFNDKED